MKIAVTGHSKGIGKSIYDMLESQGHTVKGYSRSNGWDISTRSKDIVEDALDCDVFVNNAYQGLFQIDILNMLFEHWSTDPSKTIVNMGSKSKYYTPTNLNMGTINKDYVIAKKELDKVAKKLMMYTPGRKCRLINLNPGFVATDMLAETNVANPGLLPLITPEQVADVLNWALSFPANIEIGELSIWSNYNP